MALIPLALLALSASGADFVSAVYPILVKANCAGCHSDEGVASPTRLHFPEAKPSTAQIEAFGRSLHIFVDRNTPAKSLLLSKPTRRVPHAGGVRIEPGSDDEKALQAWVDYLATAPIETLRVKLAENKPFTTGPVLRRLTHSQYNNTLRDLLGENSRLADQFPPEDFVNGFRNQYEAQNTSPLLAEAYAAAAEKIARKVFLGGDPRGLIPCKPKSPEDAVCRDRFLRDFGLRAFRRPLAPAEQARYAKLFAAEAASSKSFSAGAQVAVEVMLQSPNFLMRSENGLDLSLKPYETASKLSYFAWNTMPDAALLDAARSGELNTPEGVERQMRRLLESPKARESVDEFVTEWLRFDRLTGTVRDRRLYPQFTPELTLAMTEETRRLVAELVWKKGNFMEFYSAGYTYANGDLAKLYQVPAPKEDYGKVELPESTARGGVLSHASFLTMTSKPAETSPTSRGLFVREQFLCQDVPQPPPGVNVNLPPISKDQPRTQKDRLSLHLNNESCASCHSLIDPIGLGFEKFDAIGGYREKLMLTIFPNREERREEAKKVELELDTRGNVAGLKDSSFSTPRELGKILAGTPQCQQCVAKQLFRWMAGRHERAADKAVIERAFEDFRHSGFQFQELMIALARRSIFPEARAN